ncbi:hypothetical protein P7K49_028199 [Saguinus oedipus]|uniref:Nucleolar protein 4 n=1 Tax=Saguinus oedipus TaxID=9490 RepID=A0ABQ9UC18_SAGOE|nr:hypothetical protein P7K49_028199 [Saguinus oedipus]
MESERDMYRQFQDWCLRTYGDSGKTKTVTRKKYERIVQLLNGSETSSTDNAKFKFWVKSKGFQLGQPDEVRGGGGGAKQVLYVPVKTTRQRTSRAGRPPRLGLPDRLLELPSPGRAASGVLGLGHCPTSFAGRLARVPTPPPRRKATLQARSYAPRADESDR